jgi:hypothetical protein
MKIKQVVKASVGACASLVVAGSVNAATAQGPVEQVYSTGTTTYVYVAPDSTWAIPPFVWYCSTTDADLARIAGASLHKNARIYCSNTTFPTSGTYRSGGVLTGIATN